MGDLLARYRDQISMAPVQEQERNRSDETGHHGERRRKNNRRGGEQRHKGCYNPRALSRSGLVCFRRFSR
jgi:hypothetical protein